MPSVARRVTSGGPYLPVPGDIYDLEGDREGPHGRIMRYDLNAEGG